MKKLKGMSIAFVASLTMSLVAGPVSYAAKTSLQGWDLVDSGKHCDWTSDTIYPSYLEYGIQTWEGHKSGIFRKDTATTIQDLKVTDYTYERGPYVAETLPSGVLKFNTYYMNMYTRDQKKAVAIHEIGHVLGLGHNTSDDIMYEYVSTMTWLSTNDKASYDAAYKKY